MRLLLTFLLAFASAPLLATDCDECLAKTGCAPQLKECLAKCAKGDDRCTEACELKDHECAVQARGSCSLKCEQVMASVQPIWAKQNR
ncbi:hypothetical protein DFR29_108153 [Tahibacter aquaticus]|jgi:hypothetical protein|uniref:Uncharacterized protein n=1 Tax=Tahibacter aquaticus TaxID=520092 RepID=A0A4R6YVG0_9GAMM|nr:hypothetical protein [Tahibacter aquaticus]TDR42568.1 hypothetical protein DFR29_108153 [Tahibacter aquaticus]